MTVLGIEVTSSKPVVGWEAVRPKPHSKPEYLRQAQRDVDDLWKQYMILTNIDPLPWAEMEELYDRIGVAEIWLRRAWKSYERGLGSIDYMDLC